MADSSLRVRFAPSPTGFLHVGGARTALFNWLLARNQGGVFILRIEDTDVERSSQEMAQIILDSLSWLGIGWDEGPFYQSHRLDLYRQDADRLLAEGKAYRCFCLPEELEAKRKAAEAAKRAWIYDRTCLRLTRQEARRRQESGLANVVRFQVPEGGETVLQDLIQGEVRFENSLIEDFVLLRSDGMPTYHLSVVSDDVEMRVSHVIRGADHLSNAPKQLLLYQALGLPRPQMGHLPLILGADRKRLSKRHGATSVEYYREQGILPQALANYLALLGWSPGGEQEIMDLDEIARRFDLARVNKANAVFDAAKLEWINAQHMQRMNLEKLAEVVGRWLAETGLSERMFTRDAQTLQRAVALLRPRCKTIRDFTQWGRAFFVDDFPIDPEGHNKYLADRNILPILVELADRYEKLPQFSLASTEEVLRQLASERNVKPGALIGAVRVAVTGNPVAPGLFDVIVYLGKQRTVARIRRAAGGS
ncbi:MAG TPA: glutamate--tRNA ligase [Acidobacteriota bacterium]|jgi:glutamyl-tRNA synthetase